MATSRSTTAPFRRHPTLTMPFNERASLPNTSPLAVYLFRLMTSKNTNLCLSADVQTTSELLEIAEECGDSICVLKTHCDIIWDFGDRTIKGLLEISLRKRFLIFEDRKFGDIGNTVQIQYAAGTHKIASWAGITNAHIFPGPAIITALQEAAQSAISVSNYSNSTEIFGGVEAEDSFSPSGAVANKTITNDDNGEEKVDDNDDQDEDEDEDEDEDAEDEKSEDESSEEEEEEEDDGQDTFAGPPTSVRSTSIPIRQTSPLSPTDRKASIISISTTISSSTEYVSPSTSSLPGKSSSRHPSFAANSRSSSFASAAFTSQSALFSDHPPLARGLLLLAQMSSKDNLFTPSYTSRCVELARAHRDFVMGFIAQGALNSEPNDNFLVMTPGVALPPAEDGVRGMEARPRGSIGRSATTANGDALGQQYNSPRSVVLDKGVDIIIVGRGILNAEDREAEAERYRVEGWRAIVERTGRRASRGEGEMF